MLLCAAVLRAGQPVQKWLARYDDPQNDYDKSYAVAVDVNQCVYVTGYSHNIDTATDYVTIKYDPNGAQLWLSRYNGPANSGDLATAIAVDTNGYVYVTGQSQGVGSGTDYATVKYEPNGAQVWAARYNGTANTDDAAYSIALDSSGSIYVTGQSNGSGPASDYVTIKYDPNGTQRWVARYNGTANDYDAAYALVIDSSGGIYVTGESTGSGSSSDYVTIKYDPNGTQKWLARYNGTANDYDSAFDIAVDSQHNVYVTGQSEGLGSGADYATIKYDPNGNQIWVSRYNGPANDFDSASAIAVDESGYVYVIGQSTAVGTGEDYATIRYEPNGAQSWVARYDGPASGDDAPAAIALDKWGYIYITGQSIGDNAANDYATIRYDAAGNQNWAVRYEGPAAGKDIAYALAVDSQSNVYVTGESVGISSHTDFATIKYSQQNLCLPQIAGDLDEDCDVDFADFAILARAWLTQSGQENFNPACDISQPKDNIIDWLDLAVLIQNWLAGPQ